MSFKKITLSDPLAVLPPLELVPGIDGYKRSLVNLRKAKSRTYVGATVIAGTVYSSYYTWSININIVEQEKTKLFSDYLEMQNYRLGLPSMFPDPTILLADEYREVPASPLVKYTFIQNLPLAYRPYGGGSLQPAGFAVFRVLLNADGDYLLDQTSCRGRLQFSAEEVA